MEGSSGAVALPPSHLSARVPWHDTDWTGRVCAAPAANQSCTVLGRVKEEKDPDAEEAVAGKAWTDLPQDQIPPCLYERAGFMRSAPHLIARKHAYAGGWTRSHANFAETSFRMPAYSVEAIPFRWVMRDRVEAIARQWDIGYDQALEDRADEYIETKKPTDWVQDRVNQTALLDSFFSSLVPGRSLVFLYAKDVPLLADRRPGARVLIGVGRVTEEPPPAVEWEYSGKSPVESIFWERPISHSIRPSLEDGFLLPYHQLLESKALGGRDLDEFVALAPQDHFDEFSYVSERVGDDGAIAALGELARVVDLLPGVVDGPWDTVTKWLGDRLAETWVARGAYPGLGSVLAGARIERGPLIAHRVLETLPSEETNPWPALEAAMVNGGSGPAKGLVGRTAGKIWGRIMDDEDRYAALRLVARFALTVEQAERLLDAKKRDATDAELLENPYLVYELERGDHEGVALTTVDRGLFPHSVAARAALDQDPLPEPIDEAGDDRRVRAAAVDVLERGAGEGHTILDEPTLRRRISALELDPVCDPNDEQFEIAAEEFEPTLVQRETAKVEVEGGETGDGAEVGGDRAWQLDRLAATSNLIAAEVRKRVEEGPLDVQTDWRAAIDAAIDQRMPTAGDPELEIEEAARTEKAGALEILATRRIAALVGQAGTGKTTMLKALCSDPVLAGQVLLLAPTGKARVQLGEKVEFKARTLAQFLGKAGRWDWDRGYYLNPAGMSTGGFGTVVVDEASMLTEEMLAALIESLKEPTRLILCGDPRQLPPIGAGRPFADLLAFLGEQAADGPSGGGIAELEIGRRQQGGGQRSDAAVAATFSTSATPAGADQVFARAVAGEGDDSLTVVSWEDEADLHQKLIEVLCADPELELNGRDKASLMRSLGAEVAADGRVRFEYGNGGSGAERWQVLSPTRSRAGGIAGLNAMVRKVWRPGDAAYQLREKWMPNPLGADQVLFGDKTMCLVNRARSAWDPKARQKLQGDVANGEIGIATSWPKGGRGLSVEFSTQESRSFTFWESELNGNGEGAEEMLEVAYAITVHKSQGSQFARTFVVVPVPCPVLSPELLYTALTRHRGRVTLFVQGDPLALLEFSDPARSESARRLTCLFRPPHPFTAVGGSLLDGAHVHRSANGELMRSKSEVIVANTLRHLGVPYAYEELLKMEDGSVREPDFTIRRPGELPVYWEHLGMLDLAGYRADWEAKLAWYSAHGIQPLADDGGPAGSLVWSSEVAGGRIDSEKIEAMAVDLFGDAGSPGSQTT
jgi:ATP-dependent exoDNAse (exonuclease V) alpha subunit